MDKQELLERLTGARAELLGAVEGLSVTESTTLPVAGVWTVREILADVPDEDLVHVGLFRGPYWDNLAGWLRVAWEHEQEHAAQIRAWRAG